MVDHVLGRDFVVLRLVGRVFCYVDDFLVPAGELVGVVIVFRSRQVLRDIDLSCLCAVLVFLLTYLIIVPVCEGNFVQRYMGICEVIAVIPTLVIRISVYAHRILIVNDRGFRRIGFITVNIPPVILC